MSHPRQEIRDAMFSILQTALASQGILNFSKNRFRKFWEEEELPAVTVYTLSETSEIFDTAPRSLKRTLTLAVEVTVQDNEGLDDTVDNLALLIENAIYADETLGGKAWDVVLTGTDIIQKTEGEKITGAIILVFDVKYVSYAPGIKTLDDLEEIHSTLVQSNDANDLSSTIEVET